MKASLCPMNMSTRGAGLRSQASALTVSHFQNAISDTDAILGVLFSKGTLRGDNLRSFTLKSSGRSSGIS